jgi:hypothetical protein
MITGHVSYALERDFPADSIVIEISGKERLLWDGYDPRAVSKKHTGKIYLKTVIFKTQYVIHKFAGPIKQWSNKIPFSV